MDKFKGSDRDKKGKDRKTRRSRMLKTGKGSMFWRILSLVPFPAMFGDIVNQTTIVAEAVGTLRSPLDGRWHLGLELSEYTAHRRRQLWHRVAKILKKGFKGLSLRDIRREHIWYVIDVWRRQGTGPGTGRRMDSGTLINMLVYLRALLAFVRLDALKIVPSNSEVLRYMERGPRVFYDGRDKSLEGSGVDFWEIYRKAEAVEQRVAIVFLLCWLLGFRVEESTKWRGRIDYVEQGGEAWIWVRRGGKNGKKRSFKVPLSRDLQLAVHLANRYASDCSGGLIPDGMREEKFRRRIYTVARKIGFTRRGMDVTPHSLRHSFAQRIFRLELARRHGGRVPARPLQPHEVESAGGRTTESLGHHRLGITAVYVPSLLQSSTH